MKMFFLIFFIIFNLTSVSPLLELINKSDIVLELEINWRSGRYVYKTKNYSLNPDQKVFIQKQSPASGKLRMIYVRKPYTNLEIDKFNGEMLIGRFLVFDDQDVIELEIDSDENLKK